MPVLQRHGFDHPVVDLGDDDPLYTRNLAKGPPDRRRVSLRWLAGSVLTGLFSAAFVGGALQAAIGLDDYLVVRPALAHTGAFTDAALADKGDRFRPVPESNLTRRVIQISTVTRTADRDIVRVRPFAHIQTNLAAPIAEEVAKLIPSYRPSDVFSDGEDEPEMEVAASDSIYGAEVDGEVSIKVTEFPMSGVTYDETAALDDVEVEQAVREAAPDLADGAVEIASLPYVDPARFDPAAAEPGALNAIAIAIAPENVSQVEKTDELEDFGMEENVLKVEEGASMRQMLIDEGADPEAAGAIQSALVANFSFDFRAGQKLRLGLAPDPDTGALHPVRVSLYEPRGGHIATVALSDNGAYVAAQEPDYDAELLDTDSGVEVSVAGALPTLHEGLWGTGLSLDIPDGVLKALVHVFSFDVDYQARLSAADGLEVIYSAEGTEDPEILYAALTLSGVTHRFYRYRDPATGEADYYDEAGKSAQKFLVRKPVAQGRFSSSFGMRRHPILKRYRMHTGADWAAPTGTPIMAAGDGEIKSIGTRAGYGRSITLTHTNGYQTTYNHMSGYAKGLKAGERVSQGQVIGFVGSTGLSTGPHLHFEVLVNERFVDPMKIRLPRGHELNGTTLVAFEQERERIDQLLAQEERETAAN